MSKPIRVLFFNRSFHPDIEATGLLLTELCADLSEHCEVTVIAGRPYIQERFGSWLPIRRERLGRVEILRAYNPRFAKRVFVGRVLNLLSYFCFSFLAGFLVHRPQVVVAETDPPVLGILGLFFAKLYRAKFVFYLQDLFPDVGVALGKLRNPILIRFLDVCTRLILRRADRVIVLGDDMRQRVERKKCCAPDRVHLIPNWIDTRTVCPLEGPSAFRERHGLEGKFIVMFAGNVGLSQGLPRVLDVAQALAEMTAIQFVFIGEGAGKASLVARARELGLQNILFLPYHPPESRTDWLGTADLHLVPLERGLAGLIVPSKVYGILSVGGPFVAPIDADSEVAAIIEKFHCGIRVDPDSVEQLREAILWSFQHPTELHQMGANAREAVVQHFDREISVGKFRSLLAELRPDARLAGSSDPRLSVVTQMPNRVKS